MVPTTALMNGPPQGPPGMMGVPLPTGEQLCGRLTQHMQEKHMPLPPWHGAVPALLVRPWHGWPVCLGGMRFMCAWQHQHPR